MREYERLVPEVVRRNDPHAGRAEGMMHWPRGGRAEAIASFRAAQALEGCRTC